MRNPEKMRENLSGNPGGLALLKAVDYYGSASALASALAFPKQRVDNWIYLLGRPSKQGAAAIEALGIGISKQELRPDVDSWQGVNEPRPDHKANLAKTQRGCGLMLALSRCGNSTKVLAKLAGVSGPQVVQEWIERGYIPKRHVQSLLALPEFAGLTAETLRPDLHPLEYSK